MNVAWDKVAKLTLAVAGVLVLFYFLNPVTFPYAPRCMFHSVTGWHCPGCGSTRALHQLAHGHVATAFRYNPLAIAVLPFLFYYICRRDQAGLRPAWLWALVAAVIGFGLLRNLPVWPLTLLAP